MDENRLIEDAQKGDLDSFNSLVLKYQEGAYNLACRLLCDIDLAADATQNAFLNAWKAILSFRGGSFRAWILRMVANQCYDELRRQRRRPTTPLEPYTGDDEEIETPFWIKDTGPSPEESLETNEVFSAIQHCMDRLPVEFREIAILIDVEGLDYEEASQTIHKPIGTVKSRLARARSNLRKCLHGFRELLPSTFRLKEEGLS